MNKTDKMLVKLFLTDLLDTDVIDFFKNENGNILYLYTNNKDTHTERYNHIEKAKENYEEDNLFKTKEINYKNYDLQIIPKNNFVKKLLENYNKSYYRLNEKEFTVK